MRRTVLLISLFAAATALLPGCSTFPAHQAMADRVSQLEVDVEQLLQMSLPKDRAYGGGAYFVTPDLANCTARCRRNNCRGKSGQEFVDCFVMCYQSCK
jgi:hypothetical protein